MNFRRIFILYGREYSLEEIQDIASFCEERGILAATVSREYWSQEIQDIFDEKGIRVYIYTVNDPEEASYYREEGAAESVPILLYHNVNVTG